MMNVTEHKMARLKNVMVDLQNEIYRAELTLEQIAVKYDVPMDWVDTAFAEVLEQAYEDRDMGDIFLNEGYEEDECLVEWDATDTTYEQEAGSRYR
jgi:hypothetical protein